MHYVLIPIAPEALEPVLKKARENGIIVIAHEGSTLTNIDYDVEAFTEKDYGAYMMDLLAEQRDTKENMFVWCLSLLHRPIMHGLMLLLNIRRRLIRIWSWSKRKEWNHKIARKVLMREQRNC